LVTSEACVLTLFPDEMPHVTILRTQHILHVSLYPKPNEAVHVVSTWHSYITSFITHPTDKRDNVYSSLRWPLQTFIAKYTVEKKTHTCRQLSNV